MDKKSQQKQITERDNAVFVIDYNNVFQNKGFEEYVFKRLEKISLAVHLLSSLLMDNEPAKNRLKELSLTLISKGISLSDIEHTSEASIKKILSIITEIHSIFEIIQVSQLMSEMNCVIIKEEIIKLLNTIISNKDFYQANKPSFLAGDFFGVPEYKAEDRSFTSHSSDQIHRGIYKGQKDIKDNTVHYKNPEPGEIMVHNSQDKDKRQEVILNMLKEGKILTVKDFSKEIKGCSEKTIQRELLSLVAKGSLKKEGERRWSRYSLI